MAVGRKKLVTQVRETRGATPDKPATLAMLQDPGSLDYRSTPHLGQWGLHRQLLGLVHSTIDAVRSAGLPLRVLEVGAGHGGFTAALLATGAEVTLAESSARVLSATEHRFASNPRLRAVHAPGLDLAAAGGDFTLVVAVSVLHHAPDYLGLIDELTGRLRAGGALVLMQEPCWYPRAGRLTRVTDRTAYLAWRVSRGDVRAGLKAVRRRLRHEYPVAAPGELTYHHVVRDGVDEQEVLGRLGPQFAEVRWAAYWSNHFGGAAALARLARLRNTFAVQATGYLD